MLDREAGSRQSHQKDAPNPVEWGEPFEWNSGRKLQPRRPLICLTMWGILSTKRRAGEPGTLGRSNGELGSSPKPGSNGELGSSPSQGATPSLATTGGLG